MKKTVILILLIAPLILIYIISFAGRVLGDYTYIYVERVVFLDEENDEIENGETIVLNMQDQYQLSVKVYPELAYNKHYRFIYDKEESVFEINNSGLLTATKAGISRLTVQTTERSLKTEILIQVLGTEIEGVLLNAESLSLGVGSKHTLTATIYPQNATGSKTITWASSNKSVAEVNLNGEITAKSEGVALITATTSNGKQATVEVVVENKIAVGVYFIADNNAQVIQTTNSLLNLEEITEINLQGVNYSDLNYSIVFGASGTSIVLENINNQTHINFNGTKTMVRVKVEVIGTSYYDEIAIVLI